MVCCVVGRSLKCGHQQLVSCELPFDDRRLQLAMCTVIISECLRTIVRGGRGVEQPQLVSGGNGDALMLLSHAG